MAAIVTSSIDEDIWQDVWDEERTWREEKPVQENPPEPLSLVIFGATGDLAHRKLIPALYSLMSEKLLPDKFAIVGFGRSRRDEATFRAGLRKAVESSSEFSSRSWDTFAEHLTYVQGAYDDEESFKHLGEILDRIDEEQGTQNHRLFYLATPPDVYSDVAGNLGAAGLNKPTQEGQYQHFKAIAEAVDKPLVLYNVPGRTAANIEPATLSRLAKISNIIAVKEASGSMTQIAEVLNLVPDDFVVFSGDDAITLPVISLGGQGIISVASNVIPAELSRMTQAALDGDWIAARKLHRKYLPLMQALFFESNPMPVKCVLAMMGRIDENYRLPMLQVKPETRAKLERIAAEVGLLAGRVAAR